MTILFSDVRGFTTISEYYKDDPQGLTRLMNRFLTVEVHAQILESVLSKSSLVNPNYAIGAGSAQHLAVAHQR
jgi:hypothetical protein